MWLVFFKQLAHQTGFQVTAVLDDDYRPQSKRASYTRRYNASMAKINGFYCRQSDMALSSKSNLTASEEVDLYAYNKESKKLDTISLIINTNFLDKLKYELDIIGSYNPNDSNNGCVDRDVIKAEY